jgi:flagellin-specific chaperone FliS
MESGEIAVKVFGYKNDSEELIELEEVSFQSDIEELDKIIKFLQEVKEQHSKVIGETELCHSHFRDWDVDWKAGSTDIIFTTILKK